MMNKLIDTGQNHNNFWKELITNFINISKIFLKLTII